MHILQFQALSCSVLSVSGLDLSLPNKVQFKPVLWIRILLRQIRIRGSALGKKDSDPVPAPDPALGERFVRVLIPLLGFSCLYFRIIRKL